MIGKFTSQNSFIVESCNAIVYQSRGLTGVCSLKLVREDLSGVPHKSFGSKIRNNEVINEILRDSSRFTLYRSQ